MLLNSKTRPVQYSNHTAGRNWIRHCRPPHDKSYSPLSLCTQWRRIALRTSIRTDIHLASLRHQVAQIDSASSMTSGGRRSSPCHWCTTFQDRSWSVAKRLLAVSWCHVDTPAADCALIRSSSRRAATSRVTLDA